MCTAYLARQAQSMVSYGAERGDNDALARTIHVYSTAFEPLPLTGVSRLDAHSSTALKRAIDVYRSAVDRLNREDVPFDWAQNRVALPHPLAVGSLGVYPKASMAQRDTDLVKKVATVRTMIAAAKGR